MKISTKRALSLLTVILVFMLGVAGTLMFMSGQTGSAINTVSFGTGVDGILVEDVEPGDPQQKADIETGFEYKYINRWRPGQPVPKAPFVKRTDADLAKASDAYVAVKLTPSVTISQGKLSEVNSYSSAPAPEFTKTDIDNLYIEILNFNIMTNTSWAFYPVLPITSLDDFWCFYISAGVLAKLPPGNDVTISETPNIFDTLAVPTTLSKRELELFAALGRAGVEFKLDMTAYLEAVSRGTYNNQTDIAGYKLAFPDVAIP